MREQLPRQVVRQMCRSVGLMSGPAKLPIITVGHITATRILTESTGLYYPLEHNTTFLLVGGKTDYFWENIGMVLKSNGTYDPSLAQPTAALQVGTPTTVDFSLEKGAVIQGIVTDPSGTPVSNASVSIQSGECYGWGRAAHVAWTSTNQDGTYSVAVPPGTDYYVYVSPQATQITLYCPAFGLVRHRLLFHQSVTRVLLYRKQLSAILLIILTSSLLKVQ